MNRRWMSLLAFVAWCFYLQPQALTGAEAKPHSLADYAREMREQLRAKVLPYWYDTAIDKTAGGYLLADDLAGPRRATEKQLVSQTRMIWGFAHAHLKGFSTPERDCRQAAAQGYHFLTNHFLDLKNGGYYWKMDLDGKVTNDRKILYGQSFAVYALVEYHRASGDAQALRLALDLYHLIQKRGHDGANSGWLEHFTRDWTPIMAPGPGTEVEVAGYKSANAHLHWMEALSELYAVTQDREVKKSLAEAIDINATWFYPANPGKSAFHRQPDWKPVRDQRSQGLSYGHNVEFAWLMVRAQMVLGKKPSWSHFDAHIRHALKFGYDHERGGLYSLGQDDQPATNTNKVWWVQAEMLAALTDALKHKPDPQYEEALKQLLDFVVLHQTSPDGIWLDTVSAEGKPIAPGKAHSWKANYHDVRAMVKFVGAFGL
jgi:mannobiose 2-epimerase